MALFSKKPKEKEETKVKEKAAEVKVESGAVSLPKGEDAHAYEVVLKPLITEKGSMMGPLNKYVFQVADSANKISIKEAIEKLYKVDVVSVHVLKVQSKKRVIGKYKGHKPGFKKAIVTLRAGDKIDLTS